MTNWYVIRTNPQCEQRAKAALEDAGFTVFFPTFCKETKHSRTKAWQMREYPLFNRYMFIEMPKLAADWFTVRRADGVECLLGVAGEPFPVAKHIVEQTRREVAAGVFDQTRSEGNKIKPGERVRIADGPLTGFYGMVTDADGRKKVKVLIEMFKTLSEAEIPLAMLEKTA